MRIGCVSNIKKLRPVPLAAPLKDCPQFGVFDAPIGKVFCCVDSEGALIKLRLFQNENDLIIPTDATSNLLAVSHVRKQLDEYFAGKRQVFDLKLSPVGTDFRKMVWNTLLKIPFGQTWTYGTLARQINQPKAARAVGQANHHNPIWLVIPCHRVIGSTGNLTGYAGGLNVKKWLLDHEAKLKS